MLVSTRAVKACLRPGSENNGDYSGGASKAAAYQQQRLGEHSHYFKYWN